jgi:hypothetical protein
MSKTPIIGGNKLVGPSATPDEVKKMMLEIREKFGPDLLHAAASKVEETAVTVIASIATTSDDINVSLVQALPKYIGDLAKAAGVLRTLAGTPAPQDTRSIIQH